MTISSRTPEGLPSNCPLCGAATKLEFSDPAGDAPCPQCGHLLWKSTQLLGQFQQLFAKLLSVPANGIDAQTVLDDLRADSIGVVEMVMEFEDEFDVTVHDDDYEQFRTIGDVVRYIERRQRDG